MLSLSTPIEKINRVGEITAKRLKKIGLNTINDLLFYYPFRYDDFSETSKIPNLTKNLYPIVSVNNDKSVLPILMKNLCTKNDVCSSSGVGFRYKYNFSVFNFTIFFLLNIYTTNTWITID